MLDVVRQVRGRGRGVHDFDAKELGQEVVGCAESPQDDLAIDCGGSHGLQLGGVVDVGDGRSASSVMTCSHDPVAIDVRPSFCIWACCVAFSGDEGDWMPIA